MAGTCRSVAGTISHLVRTYVGTLRQYRETGNGDGKREIREEKVCRYMIFPAVNRCLLGFKRCTGTTFCVYGFPISLSYTNTVREHDQYDNFAQIVHSLIATFFFIFIYTTAQ